MIQKRSLKKRGQLTIFILVSVLLVLAIVLFFYLKDSILQENIPGSESVQGSISDCVDFSTSNALYFVSYQGGYTTPPEKYFSFSPTFFPYYYYEGERLMPSLNSIEEQMASHVESSLRTCLDSISYEGFVVSYDTLDAKVSIQEEGVDFVIDGFVTIQKDDLTMRVALLRTPQFYPTQLYTLYEMSSFFVDDLLEDPNYYCITCLTRMAEASNTKFYVFPLLGDNVFYVMVFEDTIDPVVFNFVVKIEEDQNII